MLKLQIKKHGDFLFRYRSFIPLFFFILLPIHIALTHPKSYISDFDRYWTIFCFALSAIGQTIRIFTIGYARFGTSGTNTKSQKAEHLNTDGIYSIVRHPLYLGNYLMWLGIVCLTQSIYLILIISLLFFIYYERIMFAEEAFLQEKYGEIYEEWAKKTPAFFPSFKNYKPSELTFSFKKVFKNEYKSFIAFLLTFVLVKYFVFIYYWHLPNFKVDDYIWLSLATFALLIYLPLRIAIKKLKYFDLKGER